MFVKKINLKNFRNYKDIELSDLTNLNIIIGRNGIGKTSILESIYLCSIGKSFRSNNDYVMIHEENDFFKAIIDIKPTKKVEILLNKAGKLTKINNKKQTKLTNFINQYKVIVYSPDQTRILKDNPGTRRSYFNIQISQIDSSYLKLLKDYNVLIKDKNEYLKRINWDSKLDYNYLDILDEKLVEIGLKIYKSRLSYIELVNKYILGIIKQKNIKDMINLEYKSDFDKEKGKLLTLMKEHRQREVITGITAYGVHRDDIKFNFNGKEARDFASQGQQKKILLVLKLAELDIFIKEYDEHPVLLLDDLFSELDKINQNEILKSIDDDIQTFITTTDLANIEEDLVSKANVIEITEEDINERK